MQWLMADLLKASRLENGMIHIDAGYTGIDETIARSGLIFIQKFRSKTKGSVFQRASSTKSSGVFTAERRRGSRKAAAWACIWRS